ncbi:MAG: YncE family protein [Cyclobacteriaceae bacterium]|nr:YncE family protein [Cyclobacteriaceae bacterium]
MKRFTFLVIIVLFLSGTAYSQKYYVYVTAESDDQVALIAFDSKKQTAVAEKTINVGYKPADIEGPHGITVSPDGKNWYLSIAHGNPEGFLYKFETGTDKFLGQATLGLFPASMQISTASGFLFCVNFNLHGEMKPSSVSVVDPVSMTEVTKVPIGTMPHGSRISADGLRQYSVGMMSGELFEINTLSLKVSRILNLDKNENIDPQMYGKMDMRASTHADHSMHEMHNQNPGAKMGAMVHSKIKPTWVMPHPSKPLIYVAGNGSDEILEINSDTWKIVNRMKTGKAPYNLDITPDGTKLIVSYKGDGATGIWDLEKHIELGRVSNTTKGTHGVAISTDSKYAFISVEGIGGEPGVMDVIDLKSLKKVAHVAIGKQAGGIAFWKIK